MALVKGHVCFRARAARLSCNKLDVADEKLLVRVVRDRGEARHVPLAHKLATDRSRFPD